jgi:hypothetical protein
LGLSQRGGLRLPAAESFLLLSPGSFRQRHSQEDDKPGGD